MVGKKKMGEQISVYLPYEKLEQIERIKGPYITTSKFILWCLDQALTSPTTEKQKIPQGATLATNQAPSGFESQTNDDLSSPVKERLVHVG
jgi:hypothetical protein